MRRNDKKTTVIGVPVSPAQKAQFRKAAEATGHTLASWLRMLAVKATEQRRAGK